MISAAQAGRAAVLEPADRVSPVSAWFRWPVTRTATVPLEGNAYAV